MSTQINETQPRVEVSRRANWAEGQAISYLMQQGVENPDCLSLAAGLVDAKTLPVDLVRKGTEIVLRDTAWGRHALQYGSTPGAERLRQAISEHIQYLDEKTGYASPVDPSRIVLTNGSQQFLSLVAQVLLNPGDICLVAAPTYFVFLGTIAGVGARAVSVGTDTDGMQADALEVTLAQLESSGEIDRVKLIYLVSDFENPSGYTLSGDRRERIVQIANEWSRNRQRIFVLEDAAYRELRYEGEPIPSVRSFDPDGTNVIYAGTFSKSFAPGLRIGFGIVPEELMEPITARKGNEDFGSAHLNQQVMATILEEGWYRTHTDTVRAGYRTKRDAILAGLNRYLSDVEGVEWMAPEGGLYVWLTLPAGTQTGFESPLFHEAAKVQQMMYVPGELCFGDEPENRPTNHMRLSFGVLEPQQLEEAIARLARAIHATSTAV